MDMHVEYEKCAHSMRLGKYRTYRAWSDTLPECRTYFVNNPTRGASYWVAHIAGEYRSCMGKTRKEAMSKLSLQYASAAH